MDEMRVNLMRIAQRHGNILETYGKLASFSFFQALFSTYFLKVFIFCYFVYILTFYGTEFERIPACFFVSLFIYSCISRFQYLFTWLNRWISMSTIWFFIFCAAMGVGILFMIFYSLLKPVTLLFLVYLVFDYLRDLIETLTDSWTAVVFERIFLVILFLITCYLTYRFYKWLKGTYEVFFCLIFATYGGLLTTLTLSYCIDIPFGFQAYVNSIKISGLTYTLDFDFMTFNWFVWSLAGFLCQLKFINNDYTKAKGEPTREKESKQTEKQEGV